MPTSSLTCLDLRLLLCGLWCQRHEWHPAWVLPMVIETEVTSPWWEWPPLQPWWYAATKLITMIFWITWCLNFQTRKEYEIVYLPQHVALCPQVKVCTTSDSTCTLCADTCPLWHKHGKLVTGLACRPKIVTMWLLHTACATHCLL